MISPGKFVGCGATGSLSGRPRYRHVRWAMPDLSQSVVQLNQAFLRLYREGKAHQAVSAAIEALQLAREQFGEDNANTACSLNNLGLARQAIGDYGGARFCHEQALAVYRKVHGDDHPDCAACLSNLGTTCQATGDYKGAR